MAIPNYQKLMQPVLQSASDGEISVRDCIKQLADQQGLTSDERREFLPSGRQTVFANRVHWAKTYLSQAGLLESTRRGHFRATPRGLEVLAKHPDGIDNEILMQFAEFLDFKARSRSKANRNGQIADIFALDELSPDTTPEERLETAYNEITTELRAGLLDRVTTGSPTFFEKIVIDLLISMGYGGSRANAGKRLGRTSDGGIDGVINEDPLGLDIVYIQAKRYTQGNSIGVDKVREFAGSLVERGATKGVFVTTSHFAPRASDFAERIPQRLVLIDGDELTRLMVQYGVGIRTERVIEFRKLDADYFDEEAVD